MILHIENNIYEYSDRNEKYFVHDCKHTGEPRFPNSSSKHFLVSSYSYKDLYFLKKREKADKPIYWCEGCGAIVDGGTAMMIWLRENL